MAANNLNIEPSDVIVNPFSCGYEIRVEKVNSAKLYERCIIFEEIFMYNYHLILDVLDFEYAGFLLMTLNSLGEYNENKIKQIIADEINNIITPEQSKRS